jgi:hypothetical protein
MLSFIKLAFTWLSSGPLDRVLDTVDRKVRADTDKEVIKSEIIKAHYTARAAHMAAGGFWLMLLFALPLGIWYASVITYSILWCSACAFPQTWVIAALPPPLDEWAGMMIIAIFGVVGVSKWRR